MAIEYEDMKKHDDAFTRYLYDVMKEQLSFWIEKRTTQTGKNKYYFVKGNNQIDYDMMYDIFMCVVAKVELKEDYIKNYTHKKGSKYPSRYDEKARVKVLEIFKKLEIQ